MGHLKISETKSGVRVRIDRNAGKLSPAVPDIFPAGGNAMGEHKEWCRWIHFHNQDCNCGAEVYGRSPGLEAFKRDRSPVIKESFWGKIRKIFGRKRQAVDPAKWKSVEDSLIRMTATEVLRRRKDQDDRKLGEEWQRTMENFFFGNIIAPEEFEGLAVKMNCNSHLVTKRRELPEGRWRPLGTKESAK